ncbi:MAG: thiamine pyrophosphate-dependent enzyme [Patescibacteria group bacterium]
MPCFDANTIKSRVAPTWCPGCGDFLILNSLQKAIIELDIPEEQLVIVYGIGCSGNMADFNHVYGFHGLHGRGIANAIGIKLANHQLKVIVVGGDGDIYGEGLSHLIAGARGNHDLTVLVHNNSRYSLTTGQTSPTSRTGTQTKTTPYGSVESPFNPLASMLAANAGFVARGYSTKPQQLVELIKAAITHPGFALVDTLQLCPSFNKQENHPWYSQRIYDLAQVGHNAENFDDAWKIARDTDRFGLGIVYQNKNSVPYHAHLSQLEEKTLVEQAATSIDLKKSLVEFI